MFPCLQSKPCAAWGVFSPSALTKAVNPIIADFPRLKEPDTLAQVVELVLAVRERMGPDDGPTSAFVLLQHAGDVVSLPPAWSHVVTNLQVRPAAGHVAAGCWVLAECSTNSTNSQLNPSLFAAVPEAGMGLH